MSNLGWKAWPMTALQLTRRDFYRRLASSSVLPTTAAPSLGQTKVIMEQAIQDADHVIGNHRSGQTQQHLQLVPAGGGTGRAGSHHLD